MDVSSPEHESASSDVMEVTVEHNSAFSDDGAGLDSPRWAKELEGTESEFTCEKTLRMMCRSFGIGEEDYKPLCAPRGAQGPCKTPPESSNALCVFEAMLHAGVRFPLHKFYNKVLTHFGLAPSQLTPNAWRFLAGFLLLCEDISVRPMAAVFRHYFKLRAHGGNLQGFYHFEPNHDRRLFKNKNRLPFNDGWRKRFFFLESNKPWGCPREWGMPTAEAYAKPELTNVAMMFISKLDAEKAKRDIHLLELLDKFRYQNGFPILSPLPALMQVKAEDSHEDAATTSTHPHPLKRKCLSLSLSPSPITGGTPPHQLAAVPMAPWPPGFPPIPVGSSRTGDEGGSKLSRSQILCKLIQDGETELRHTKLLLQAETAKRADEVSRLQNDVTQLAAKLKMEKDKNMAEPHRFTEDLEMAKAEHAKMREELKVLQMSHAQLTNKVEQLTKEREVAESEHRLKVRNLMEDLQAENNKHTAMDHRFKEELKAARGQHAAQVRQLQEAQAAEVNTIREQWQLKVINAEHMSGLRYAQGLRDMRDLALMMYPDADPARLTPEALTTAATSVQAASPLQGRVDLDHQ